MEIDDAVIDIALKHVRRLPSPHTEIFIGQLGGAMRRVAADATA